MNKKSSFVVYNIFNKEVIAVITDTEFTCYEGYEVIETYADEEPIFYDDNGVVKLNLIQWENVERGNEE